MRGCALVAALLIALPASAEDDTMAAVDPAVAQQSNAPWSVSATNDLEMRWWTSDRRLPGFPDQAVFNYVEQVDRLTLLGGRDGHSLWLQIDQVALFGNRYFLDDQLVIERQLKSPQLWSPLPGDSYANVEKIAYAYETKAVSLAVGDAYASFGRGIVLDVDRNVDIDIDTSIQGAKAVWRPGAWDVTAVLGLLNRQQVFQDNPNTGLRPDLRHAMGGLRAERFGLGPANVGVHGVVWDFVDEPGWGGTSTLGTPDAVAGGATLDLAGVLGLDSYLEADAFGYTSPTLFGGADPQPGYALYASSVAYPGRTVWLFEAKRYKNTERINSVVAPELYKVAVGPTLEYDRVVTEDSAAALGSNDIYGGRVRMDWAAIPVRFIPNAAVAVYRDLDTSGLHFNTVPETIVHTVVGVEAVGDHVSFLGNAGVRVDDRDGSDFGADRQIHTDVDLKFPLVGDFHADVAIGAESYHWGVNPFQQDDYVEMESALSVQKGSDVALIGYFDYTNNPLVDSIGNLGQPYYGALELQVKPTSSLTVKAFYGAYKAGIRCSGGQCRLLPGFEGARVTVTGAL